MSRLHRSRCLQLQPYRLRRRWILRILTCVFCGDPAAANYYPDADSFDNDICVYCDPGTFIFEVDMADSAGNGWSGCEYALIDESTAEIVGTGSINEPFIGNGLSTGLDYHCLAPGCYLFSTSEDESPEEVSIVLSDVFGIAYGTVGAGANYGVDFTLTGQCDFSGCTNPSNRAISTRAHPWTMAHAISRQRLYSMWTCPAFLAATVNGGRFRDWSMVWVVCQRNSGCQRDDGRQWRRHLLCLHHTRMVGAVDSFLTFEDIVRHQRL